MAPEFCRVCVIPTVLGEHGLPLQYFCRWHFIYRYGPWARGYSSAIGMRYPFPESGHGGDETEPGSRCVWWPWCGMSMRCRDELG
jgi:hypothetical protein